MANKRLANKKILLIIGGGVAAYKALDLTRRLMDEGASVRGILTKGGSEFITPLSVASLSGDQCYTDLFSLKDEAEMGHIRLSREADLILIAPATADLMAKMAAGLAGDLASTVLLATDKPVIVAPTMNAEMWHHKATQRNIKILKEDGVHFIDPGEGMLACGEVGRGRLAEVPDIVTAVVSFCQDRLAASQLISSPLSGRAAEPSSMMLKDHHIVITAGPTYEPIDPVRYIANRSSGRQGYAVAQACADHGARVTLVSGPVELDPPEGVDRIMVESALEMRAAVHKALPADVVICIAAVADWRTAGQSSKKLKKSVDGLPVLELIENPDILKEISGMESGRPKLVIGFAAETHEVIDYAVAKRHRKGCDWIVANDVSEGTGVMGGLRNTVTLITDTCQESWPEGDKQEIAHRLVAAIAHHLVQS